MILYLIGPMKGKPNSNAEAFDKAAKDLRAAGYDVISPVELARVLCIDLSEPLPKHHRLVLIEAECMLLTNFAGAAATMDDPDIADSEGAATEVGAAAFRDMRIRPVSVWLREARRAAE